MKRKKPSPLEKYGLKASEIGVCAGSGKPQVRYGVRGHCGSCGKVVPLTKDGVQRKHKK